MRTFLRIAVVIFVVCGNNLAQLSGTKTVGSGGDYETIAAAITALNSSGVGSGGVTFNISAGHTENITSTISLTATGTSSNPIILQKSGSGTNPKITRTDTGEKGTSVVGGDGDALLKIEGSDYVTFDGIDLKANESSIEYGYMFHKPSGINGCQNVTIKNCTIEMNKNSDYVIGIYIGNGTELTYSNAGVTVTSNDGKNQDVTIISNTIQNVHIGVYVLGFNNSSYYDNNITIGQNGAGNTIQNFAGGASSIAYGIYFLYVNNPTASYNTITSSEHSNNLYGILFNKPGSSNVISGNVVASNNSITLSNSFGITSCIGNGNGVTSETYNNNTFASGTISSTSNTYLIYSHNSTQTKTISGNQINGTFTTSGGAGNLYCYYNQGYASSSGTETFSSNNFSNIQVSGSSGIMGIYSLSSNVTRTINGNTLSNWTSGTGNTWAIYSASSNSSEIYNNNINIINASGIIYAFYLSGSNVTAYQNNVNTLSTSAATLIGLYYNGYGTSHLYRNQIYNLSSTATSTVKVYGIYYYNFNSPSSFDLYLYNNYVSDLKAPNSDGTDNAVAGMYFQEITGSSNKFLGVYFNTIFLNASSAGTDFGSAGIYSHSGNNLDLRNNIFINNSTPAGSYKTTALMRSGIDLSTYSNNSNSNCFFAGIPGASNLIYYDGTNSDQTISEFKLRVFPKDEYSFSETPPFVNSSAAPYNLHISSGTATRVESGGVPIASPIAINNDFDDNARHNYYPDLGADEGNFTLQDELPPYISYEAMGTGGNGSTRAFRDVIIVDPSNVNTTSGTAPRAYYKKSTNANDYVGNTNTDNGWKWVEGTLNSDVFNFTIDYTKLTDGGVSPGDVIQYFVVAQDQASTPHVKINSGYFNSQPASVNLSSSAFPITGTINQYSILQSISADILVGFGNTYTSFTANSSSGLFKAINDRVVTGNITAKITSDIYETGEVALNESLEEVLFTINIKPNDSSPKEIYGNGVNGLINLDGADKVTIDGSYEGDNFRMLFRNSNSNAPVFTFKNSASQNTIKNIIIEGASKSGYNGTIFFSTGSNESNTVQNCTVRGVSSSARPTYGIYFDGSSNSGNTVTGCTIYDFLSAGIYVYNSQGGLIEKNEIYSNEASTYSSVCGMIIYDPGSEVLTVSKNKIHSLEGTSSSTIKGIYLENSFGGSPKLSIENNSVILTPTTTGTIDGIDVELYTANFFNIYFNSIYIEGNLTSGSNNSYGIRKREEATTFNLKNNVFSNYRYNNGGSGNHYAIYFNNTSGTLDLNYNDYYVNGSGAVLAYWSNENKTTIGDWQTASGQDANSLNQSPKFTSASNLKPLSGSALLAAGTPITGITTDIENISRNGTNPSIGAYENAVTEASLDWCNLHDPQNASRLEGEGLTVYARVYKDGVTNGAGQGSGITCWFGYNSQNTNPNTWTNWESASYSGDAEINRDVYTGWIGANLAPGTYYYTSRFLIDNGQYQYGGFSTDGGGFWNGTNYVSGVLTVETNDIPFITIIPPVTPPDYPTVKRRNTTEFKGRVQVTEVTTKDFSSPAISMHFLYNTENSNPNTWPAANKVEAAFVQRVDDKHEYSASLGDELPVGTYYVATKATLPGGTTQYGGYSSSGGGIWNGTTNVSTRLDITENSSSEPNSNSTIHPPVTPNNLNAVTKVNNTVFAVGDYGTFVKSADGGSTFTSKHKIDGFDGRLYGLDFSSESVGYTCGVDSYGNGVIGKTTNGGENWWIGEPVDGSGNKFAEGFPISSIITDEVNKVIAFLGLSNTPGMKIFESTNSGSSFVDKSESFPNINFNRARKFGTNEYYAVGDGGIVSYQAGTGTWGGPSSTGAPSNINFKDIAKNSSGKLVAVGGGKIFISNDGGSSWQEKLNVGSELVSVKFFADSDSRICVVGQDGVGLYSSDGGNTWGYSAWTDVFNPHILNDMVDKDQNNALIVGDAGTIAKTTNGGETFSDVNTRSFNGDNYSIQSTNENTLLVANDDGIFKTTNSGSNWNKLNLPDGFTGKITDIKMVNVNLGFAVSPHNNTIFKTTDGGATWTKIEDTYGQSNLEKIHAVNENVLIVYGNSQWIQVSTDGGTTWDPELTHYENTVNEIIDNKAGKLFSINEAPFGAYSSVNISTDNGSSWNESKVTSYPMKSIASSSQNELLAVGEKGRTIYTNDGGTSWQSKQIADENLVKVSAISSNTFVATGESGKIYKVSIQSGSNFTITPIESNTNKTIKNVHIPGSSSLYKSKNGTTTGWFVGEDGLIIKSTDEMLPVELFALSVTVNKNSVNLYWQTATEVDNYGFEIERSASKNSAAILAHLENVWQKVGFVQGHGHSSSVKSYSFTDKNLLSGKYLYRLKMIDTDGSFTYSNEVEAELLLPTEFTLMQNYPNPFNAQTKIKFTIPPHGGNNKVTMKLFNILGEEVKTLINEVLEAGFHEADFNASNLASGVYIYRIEWNGKMKLKKMMMIK